MSCQALGSGLSAGRSVVTAFVGLSVLWAAVRVSSQMDSNAGEGEPGAPPPITAWLQLLGAKSYIFASLQANV